MVTENELDKLRSLQDILSEKIRLEHEIEENPKQLNSLDEARARTRKAYIEKDIEYQKLKTSEEEARVLMKEAEEAREKAERSLGDPITTQREYEALDKERQYAMDKEQQHGEEVKKKTKLLLELDEQLTNLAALNEQQEKDLAEKRADIEAEEADKRKQVEVLRKKEEQLTMDLDKEVVRKFERILKNKMGLGIVAIKGNVCMGCHMILPAQFSNNVRMGEEFIFCPYCSRILFYEDTDEEELFFDIEDSGALFDSEDTDEEEFEDDEKAEEELADIEDA